MKQSEIYTVLNSDEVDKRKWVSFVENHPYGSFFNTPDAFELYKTLGNAGFVALVNSNSDILGICIYYIQPFGPALVNRIFNRVLIYGNILICNNDDVLTEKTLEVLSTRCKNGVYIEIRNLCQIHDFSSYLKLGFVPQPHLNIINKTRGNQDEIFKTFSSSRKRGIRKALNYNFIFNCIINPSNDQIESGYKLISNSYKRIKLPFHSKETFHSINKYLPEQSRLFFSLKDEGNNLIAFLVGFTFKSTFYGYYIGSLDNPETLNKRPLDLFYWEIIKYLNENGYEYFDWMGAGSPDEESGVRDFKKQYGGELIETGRLIKVNKPFRYWLIFTVLKKLYKFFK